MVSNLYIYFPLLLTVRQQFFFAWCSAGIQCDTYRKSHTVNEKNKIERHTLCSDSAAAAQKAAKAKMENISFYILHIWFKRHISFSAPYTFVCSNPYDLSSVFLSYFDYFFLSLPIPPSFSLSIFSFASIPSCCVVERTGAELLCPLRGKRKLYNCKYQLKKCLFIFIINKIVINNNVSFELFRSPFYFFIHFFLDLSHDIRTHGLSWHSSAKCSMARCKEIRGTESGMRKNWQQKRKQKKKVCFCKMNDKNTLCGWVCVAVA